MKIPYDLCCPSLQAKLLSRMCTKCKVYHATVRALKSHEKHCVSANRTANILRPKVLPTRIAARRQRELMCVIAEGDDEQQDEFEWMDSEDVDVDIKKAAPKKITIEFGTPVFSFKNIVSEWKNDD